MQCLKLVRKLAEHPKLTATCSCTSCQPCQMFTCPSWENGSQFLKLCIQRTSTSSGLKAPLIYFFYCILNTFLWLWSPYDDSTILSFLVSTHINLRLHHIWYIILAKRLKLFISGGKFFFGCFNITSVIFFFCFIIPAFLFHSWLAIP